MKELWVEKYRPFVLSDYVGNTDIKDKFSKYIDDGVIPHLLLYGIPGTGKTTMAKILYKNIECDHLYINASDENGINTIRDKVKNFASFSSFKPLKIIVLDEADRLSPEAQDSLRNVIETFSQKTRFILTCNYIDRLIPALQSRMQSFKIETLAKETIFARVEHIMGEEGIKFEFKDLVSIIKIHYPDIRKITNTCQKYSLNGRLDISSLSHGIDINYISTVIKSTSTKSNKFINIRKYIAENNLRDFALVYNELFNDIENIFPGKEANACLVIAEYQFKDITSTDKEINVMAMFSQLIQL